MSAAVLNALAREVLGVADLDGKFCIKKFAMLNEKLPTMQRCVYCEFFVDAVILFPSYSLKVMPERCEVVVADWRVDLLDVWGVHSDWLRVLTSEGRIHC